MIVHRTNPDGQTVGRWLLLSFLLAVLIAIPAVVTGGNDDHNAATRVVGSGGSSQTGSPGDLQLTFTIPSMSVGRGETDTIGIFISNEMVLDGIVVPLVLRAQTPGSYVSFMEYVLPPGSRLTTRLNSFVVNSTHPTEDGLCKEEQAGGFSGVVPADYNSPDAALFVAIGSSESQQLNPGDDLLSGIPSLGLEFTATGQPGTFLVDTTCTDPGNHLTGSLTAPTTEYIPDFFAGIVTILPTSNITVTNTDDDGPGSLRDAIEFANNLFGPDTIRVEVDGTLMLDSPLPALSDATGGTAIFGSLGAFNQKSAEVESGFILDGNGLISGSGIVITTSDNLVQDLTIRNFPEHGVLVSGGTSQSNTIARNLIYGNGGQSIALDDDGVTINDPGDADAGPNDLLNYPVISSIEQVAPNTFDIFGAAEPSATVELYIAQKQPSLTLIEDPSHHGPAYEFLGSAVADGLGEFELLGVVAPEWSLITATATDLAGNTSEMGRNKALTLDPLYITGYSDPVPPKHGSQSGTEQRTSGLQLDPLGPLQVYLIGPADSTGESDSIGVGFNSYGTQGEYDSLTDYSDPPDGTPDHRITVRSPDSGAYLIGYKLTGEPGDYLTGIGVNGHQEHQSVLSFPTENATVEEDVDHSAPRAGEDTDGASPIESIPFYYAGETGSFFDTYYEVCQTGTPGSPDVVFVYTPSADEVVEISLCSGDFDVQLYLYENTVEQGAPFACSSDPCNQNKAAPATSLTVALTAGNNYYIVVDGSGAESGSYVLAADVPDCACDCFADPVCNTVVDVFDVVKSVDVAFRAGAAVIDPNPACPREDTDVTCDAVTNVFDVVKFVDVAFRSANPATVFCNPCLP